MKKSTLLRRKILLPTFIALVLSIVMVSVGRVSPIPTITQANPVTMVYLDPPTINATEADVNTTITVNLKISDAVNIYAWQAGLTFNATVLECTGVFEGEFLPHPLGNETSFFPGTINNTAGMIRPPSGCFFLGDYFASGDGRLAYATFRVIAPGVSDVHLSDVKVLDYDLNLVPVNIIDVYTVVLDTTRHTVVTVSNLTGAVLYDVAPEYVSGFYGHDKNLTRKEISFNVAGPQTITHAGGILEISGSFSNVTIPKTLLPPPEHPRVWAVLVNGTSLSIEETIKSENETHTSVYFTFPPGKNDVQITTRFMPSTISIALSEESISLGESVTVSGDVTGADDEVRANVTVTIQNRTSGATEWDTLATVETDQNGEYTYTWEPGTTGTYEVMASWEGDLETLRDDSDVLTLKVKGKGGIPLEVVAVVAVAIIVIAAIVVYFVKIRKS